MSFGRISTINVALLVVVATCAPELSVARFTESDSSSKGLNLEVQRPTQTESGFSWGQIKEKVKSAWNSFVNFTNRTDSNEISKEGARGVAQANKPAMPVEVSNETKEAVIQWKESSEKIKSLDIAKVKEKAIPFQDPNLVMGRNNIPVFEFKKYKAKLLARKIVPVPALNVGQEEVLDSDHISKLEIPKFIELRAKAFAALETPPVENQQQFNQEYGTPIEVAKGAEIIEIPKLPPEKRVSEESINKIIFVAENENQISVLEIKSFDEEELKLLRALILFEKKDYCHVASGIFSDLLQSKKPDVVLSAHHHLGLCLNVMHLPTEATEQLLSVLEKPNRFYITALKSLLKSTPRHSEERVVDALSSLKEGSNLTKEILSPLYYLRSKLSFKNGNYSDSLSWALKVHEKDAIYNKAQFLAALSEHLTGKTGDSVSRLKRLVSDLEKKGQDKELLGLAIINLGRVSFQKASFKDSVESYQKLSKENSLWLQGLTELGWAQLQTKDAPGAIGNMHSIQSPYFDNVYKPESYIVRGIGYLNICQYADAFKALSYLEQKYLPWITQMESFSKNTPDNGAYDLGIQFLGLKQKTDLAQMPKQVLLEVLRQKEFINDQESINQLVDESSAYPFIRGLIQTDKKNLQAKRVNMNARVVLLKEKIRTINSNPQAIKNLNLWKAELALNESFLGSYEFKIETFNEGETGWVKFTNDRSASIQKMKTQLKVHAGAFMKKYTLKLAKDLKANLENNELLKYEIYAGSGENIRFQMTAGQNNRPGARNSAAGASGSGTTSPGDRRVASQKWDFDGEFWEDEIGNYRSSLKNNCKKE